MNEQLASLISPRQLTPERREEIEKWHDTNWPHPSISSEEDEQEWSRVSALLDHIAFLEGTHA